MREPLILFVVDDIVRPNIGEKRYARYAPYLLTLFFFILINNLMGLIPFFPFGANLTGNIAVTMTLAVLTLIIVQACRLSLHHLLPPCSQPTT